MLYINSPSVRGGLGHTEEALTGGLSHALLAQLRFLLPEPMEAPGYLPVILLCCARHGR